MVERGDPWLVRGPWEAVAGEARAALEAAVAGVARGCVVEIPQLKLVPGAMVARWVYRRWLAGGGHGELHELDADSLGAAGRRPGVGVVYLAGEIDRARAEELADGPLARVLIDGPAVHDFPVGNVVGIEQLDALHRVAVDPRLAEARRRLAGLCREGRSVRLVGSSGAEARLLARWAWLATSPDEPCRVYGARLPAPAGPDGWRIYEDVDSGSPAQREELEQELARRNALRSPPTLRPPRPLVERPDHPALASQVGRSEPLVRLLRDTLRAAPVGDDPRLATVHVSGPTGSGKEAVARALHVLSGRRGPMITRDLRTVPDGLVAATLFGTVKGAFTGAVDAAGLFEQARGGTLFLDEIANIPIEVQQNLLRVLEARVLQRVGGKEDIAADARLVTATWANLDVLVAEGRFLPDLLHRLRARWLRVPALSERLEDIPLLVAHQLGGQTSIDEDALLALTRYAWPGNVRELRNTLGQATLRADDGRIRVEHLWFTRPPLPILLVGAAGGSSALADLPVVELPARPASEDDPAGARGSMDAGGVELLLSRVWPDGLAGLLATLAGEGTLPVGVPLARPPMAAVPREPLLVLQGPFRCADGSVGGLHSPVIEDAVLLGRGLGDLIRAWDLAPGERVPPELDDSCVRRLRWLRERLGPRPPAAVSFDAFETLSRGHVLVERVGRGLRVTRLPATALDVRVRLVEEEKTEELAAGQEVLTGQIAQVTVGRGARTDVDLWFCAGLGAYGDLADWLRSLPAGSTVAPDTGGRGVREPDTRPDAVWRVTASERDALVGLAVAFVESGARSFGSSLAERAPALGRSPETARVAGYLQVADGSKRVKYYARLIAYPANAGVLDALAGALARFPPAYLDPLPDQVLQHVRPRMRPESTG